MRYSTNKRFEITEVSGTRRRGAAGNTLFFNRVNRESTIADRTGGVLLLGGASHADLAVRRAQADLRFDRLPSPWSHAVVVLDWPHRAGPGEILCAEVSLHPEDPAQQVPERNGVTLGTLARYQDHRRWPNLAFGTLCGDLGERSVDEVKERILDAALNPSRDHHRFPLWEWLGDWRHFVHRGGQNPLLDQRSHPGAAFCEYVYGAAGIDLTPGALEPNACPEMLWSTLLYWYPAMDGGHDAVRAWACQEEEPAPREALDMSLAKDLGRLKRQRDAAGSTGSGSPGRKRRGGRKKGSG